MDNKLKISISPTVSIREKVYRAIRDQILNGSISQGSRLIETRLAQQIKTSRTPVREALHLLEREGLLESIPRVGYRVREMKWEEVEEICEIRAVNETLAAKWAMNRITAKELDALKKNLEETERDVRNGNCGEFVDKDAEFHEILVRASGSERLMELCEQFRRHMLRYRIEGLSHPEIAIRAVEGHRRIVECIQEKDTKGIVTAIHEHMEFAKNSVQFYAFEKNKRPKRREESKRNNNKAEKEVNFEDRQ